MLFNIVDEVWQRKAVSESAAEATKKLPVVVQPAQPSENGREVSVESDQCKAYSLSPERVGEQQKVATAEAVPQLKNVALPEEFMKLPQEEGKKVAEDNVQVMKVEETGKEQQQVVIKEDVKEENENGYVKIPINEISETEGKVEDHDMENIVVVSKIKQSDPEHQADHADQTSVAHSDKAVEVEDELRRSRSKDKTGVSSPGKMSYQAHAREAAQLSASKQLSTTLPAGSPSKWQRNSPTTKPEMFKTARTKTEFFNNLVHVSLILSH